MPPPSRFIITGERPTIPTAAARRQPAADSNVFYRKVCTFAVWVYSLWNDIKPVPKLESMLSASTRPAEVSAMEYLLELQVAGLPGMYRALVWGRADRRIWDRKLKYFEPVDGA